MVPTVLPIVLLSCLRFQQKRENEEGCFLFSCQASSNFVGCQTKCDETRRLSLQSPCRYLRRMEVETVSFRVESCIRCKFGRFRNGTSVHVQFCTTRYSLRHLVVHRLPAVIFFPFFSPAWGTLSPQIFVNAWSVLDLCDRSHPTSRNIFRLQPGIQLALRMDEVLYLTGISKYQGILRKRF